MLDSPKLSEITHDNYDEALNKVAFYGYTKNLEDYITEFVNHPKLCKMIEYKSTSLGLLYPEIKGTVAHVHTILTGGQAFRTQQERVLQEYIQFLFENTESTKVVITASTRNRLMCQLAIRLGFTQEGCHKREDEHHDVMYYGLFKEDFQNG